MQQVLGTGRVCASRHGAALQDYGLCICLFHALVYLYLRHSTTWNPLALAAFFFAEVLRPCF